MYAVIQSGGKQYRVELGSEFRVDRLDVDPGDAVTLDQVLLVSDGGAVAIGRPMVDGASVTAHVLRQDRGEKVVVFKYRPKARRRVKKGFRAELTTLRVADITFAGQSAAEAARRAEAEGARMAREAEAAAQRQAAADRELAARLAAVEPAATEGPTAEAAPTEGPTADAGVTEGPTAETAATQTQAAVPDASGAPPTEAPPPEPPTAPPASDPAMDDDTTKEA
jgi:large subunit ribosomal protein L21